MSGRWWLWVLPALLLAGGANAGVAGPGVRPAAVAGAWYPGDGKTLGSYLDALLAKAHRAPDEGRVRALIAPHAGYMYSGAAAAEGYAALRGAQYRRVLVLGPSHFAGFHGLSIADVEAYQTPLGNIPLDREAVAALRRSPLVRAHPWAHLREHSIEMQLPFLQRVLAPGWRLVPVLVGDLDSPDYPTAAALLRPLLEPSTLVVVSSDFTHYGPRFDYQPFPVDHDIAAHLERLDKGALAPILAKDSYSFIAYQRATGITVCGYRPIALLLRLLPATAVGRLRTYATSGALTGGYDNSVSYMTVLFRDAGTPQAKAQDMPPPPDPTPPLSTRDMVLLHALASAAVEAAARDDDPGSRQRLDALRQRVPRVLERPSGAFVTLKIQGRLRGCIGYILPREPLAQAVLENGLNAARHDYRFPPLRAEELPGLELEVSVLTPPRPIASYRDFQVGEEGIILDKDGRSAVFLPEVAVEQGWDREQTLTYLALKAGLPGDAWREGASFRVFRSQVYAAPVALKGRGALTADR
jgi:MEMO1 family protein